jgi:ElaA protein
MDKPVMEWEIKSFDGLSTDELYDLLKLRVDVFVVEQNCAYPEIDGKDRHPETRHLLGRNKAGDLVAYSRILPPGLSFKTAGFGRVVVAKFSRGKGISHAMVDQAVAYICKAWPGEPIQIGAQLYLKKFYASHGFKAVSETYIEDGIPHVDMIRPVS